MALVILLAVMGQEQSRGSTAIVGQKQTGHLTTYMVRHSQSFPRLSAWSKLGVLWRSPERSVAKE